MKARAPLVVVGALACLILGVTAKVLLLPAPSSGSETDASPKELVADPEALFEAGVKAAADKDLERADALTRLALRRQASRPEAVAGVWAKFRNYLDGQKLPPADRLNRLLVYRESVDAALQACHGPQEFQEVWRTRAKVTGAVAEARRGLLAETEREVEDYRGARKDKPLDENLKGIARLWARLEPQFATLAATAEEAEEPGQKAPLANLVRPAIDLLDAGATAVADLEHEAEALADKSAKEKAIEPAAPGAAGEGEGLAESARKLAAALEAAQLSRWLGLAPGAADAGRLGVLHRDLARLQGRLAQLQQLRYNLWAVRQLYAAESAANWDAYLGRIEVGQLHPTVAALYSAVYDGRIKGVERAQDRVRMVQAILRSRKVQPASF